MIDKEKNDEGLPIWSIAMIGIGLMGICIFAFLFFQSKVSTSSIYQLLSYVALLCAFITGAWAIGYGILSYNTKRVEKSSIFRQQKYKGLLKERLSKTLVKNYPRIGMRL